MAYQLTGGMGATRALKVGSAAPRLEWRVLIISTGEIGLGDKIAEQNTQRRIMAGQEVRFIDVPADAGKGYGLFDWAPELTSSSERDRGRAFADQLNDASQSFFGNAGPAFVEAFIANRSRSLNKARVAISEFVTHASGTDGQVQRVARVFGLLAAAGELAIEYGIVPWPQGNALQAAKRCFEAWLSQRGGAGASEVQAALSPLRLVIKETEIHVFKRIPSQDLIRDRLGFQRARHDDDEIEYLILPESWKHIMAGRDAGSIAKQLGEIGILKRDSEGRPNPKERIPGSKKPVRVYVVSHSALFDDRDRHA